MTTIQFSKSARGPSVLSCTLTMALLCSLWAPVHAQDAPPDQANSGDTALTAPLEASPQADSKSPASPTPQTAAQAAAPKSIASPTAAPATTERHWDFAADPNAYSIVGASSGLSLHKPTYIEPVTYSGRYPGRKSELVFQFSFKVRLFSYPNDGAFYAAYTQKSFWEAYNARDSRPFRETNYNPEVFYRFIPHDVEKWHHLGVDFGFEHNSNGRSLPNSRSWNRLYVAPFQAEGNHLIYYKIWWRIPENESLPRTDPGRDDNPDIQDYYGYSELHYEQQFFGDQLADLMLRFNPGTGRGAVSLTYSIPGPGNRFFWGFFFFNGYGDSLIDYNHSVTRVGLGILFAR